jgi:hypothetical protein
LNRGRLIRNAFKSMKTMGAASQKGLCPLAKGLPFHSLQLAPEVFVVEPTLMVIGLNHRTATLADGWKCMLGADIVVSASGCPHVVLTREEAVRIAMERRGRRGGAIVAAQAQAFRGRLQAEAVVPINVALRHRLDQICRQELECFIEEHGPFTREQDQSLHAITAQVIQKIASSLARELKDLPEKGEQEQMTAAVTRLFHLDSPQQAPAGTRSEREKHEQRKPQPVALSY